MVTVTEEQHETIGRLLRHHHSALYQATPTNEAKPSKMQPIKVRIWLAPEASWFECRVLVGGSPVHMTSGDVIPPGNPREQAYPPLGEGLLT